jgi:hypothetical protein
MRIPDEVMDSVPENKTGDKPVMKTRGRGGNRGRGTSDRGRGGSRGSSDRGGRGGTRGTTSDRGSRGSDRGGRGGKFEKK